MKIPELKDLLIDFEKDDDVIKNSAETLKTFKNDMKVKGLPIENRYEIKNQ